MNEAKFVTGKLSKHILKIEVTWDTNGSSFSRNIRDFYFNQNQYVYMLASIIPMVGFTVYGFSLQGLKHQIESIFFDNDSRSDS